MSRVRGIRWPATGRVAALVAIAALAAFPGVAAGRTARLVTLPTGGPPIAGASSLRVPDFTGEGERTNGRIFGFDPVEGHFSCSGTALNTPSGSIVLTAGHCVVENGVVGRHLTFVPAYDHGSRPFGTFEAIVSYVTPQWRDGENPDFDVAALRVAPNRLGRLTEVVGGRGYVVGRSRLQNLQIFGYPAAALRGEELRSCEAHGLGSDSLTFGLIGPPTVPGTCDMAGGSSGGAWIVDGAYVDGVTSYGYPSSPNRLYSPYFGTGVGTFLAELP
jgi:V8-like Glu-specific endopeptidase